MFETANRWALINSNPFRAVKKPRVRELRAAYFTVREFSMLLASMPEGTMKDLTATAALTGMRLSELLALQWEDIDFDKRLILVQNSDHFTTKSRRNRAIPMHVEVVRLLQQRKCISRSEIIFSENGEPLSRFEASHRFKNYVRKGGYNDRLHFHSLRHTFGTLLVRTGVPIYEVKELMGHRSITTTEMYAQMASAGLHGAVGKIPLHIPSARRKGSKAIQRVA
jgi:integrase